MKKIVFIASVLLLVGCAKVNESYKQVAQCLTDKGVTMYGAFWCPHCSEQKDEFEGTFEYINYVECDPRGKNPQPELCAQKKIKGYPTWIFDDGSILSGFQEIDDLAEKAECPLPVEENGAQS